MQAGGRRFDPVWLHQTFCRCDPAVSYFENSFARILNPRASASAEARVMSDIVKRRSIRALGAAVKLRAVRYLQAFPRFRSFGDLISRVMHSSAKLDRNAVGSVL